MLNNHELRLLANKLSEKILSEESNGKCDINIYQFSEYLEHLYIHSDANIDNFKNEIWVILKTDPIFIEHSENAQITEFLNIIDWNGIIKAADIRLDFKSALEKVDHGYDLSGILHYGFNDEDIHNLAIIHRDNPDLREKIEDLLEDCNFHTECNDFNDGNYSDYIPEEGLEK